MENYFLYLRNKEWKYYEWEICPWCDGLTVIWIYYSNKDISVGQEGKHIVSVIWLNFTKQLLINHQKIVFHVLSWSWCKLGNKMLSKSRYYCNIHMLLLVHNCFHSILNYDTVQWLHQGFFSRYVMCIERYH